MTAGGTVIVYGIMGDDGKSVKLSVADTGRGMAPEVRDRLFTQTSDESEAGVNWAWVKNRQRRRGYSWRPNYS